MVSNNKDYFPDDLPQFQPGQLVRHRRYDYRGVVVDFDMRCLAEDDWYVANRTQPSRDQPWYHVFVDGSPNITYVAEENLEPDDRNEPVRHPLVVEFFESFADHRYTRNERPWLSQG